MRGGLVTPAQARAVKQPSPPPLWDVPSRAPPNPQPGHQKHGSGGCGGPQQQALKVNALPGPHLGTEFPPDPRLLCQCQGGRDRVPRCPPTGMATARERLASWVLAECPPAGRSRFTWPPPASPVPLGHSPWPCFWSPDTGGSPVRAQQAFGDGGCDCVTKADG